MGRLVFVALLLAACEASPQPAPGAPTPPSSTAARPTPTPSATPAASAPTTTPLAGTLGGRALSADSPLALIWVPRHRVWWLRVVGADAPRCELGPVMRSRVFFQFEGDGALTDGQRFTVDSPLGRQGSLFDEAGNIEDASALMGRAYRLDIRVGERSTGPDAVVTLDLSYEDDAGGHFVGRTRAALCMPQAAAEGAPGDPSWSARRVPSEALDRAPMAYVDGRAFTPHVQLGVYAHGVWELWLSEHEADCRDPRALRPFPRLVRIRGRGAVPVGEPIRDIRTSRVSPRPTTARAIWKRGGVMIEYADDYASELHIDRIDRANARVHGRVYTYFGNGARAFGRFTGRLCEQ